MSLTSTLRRASASKHVSPGIHKKFANGDEYHGGWRDGLVSSHQPWGLPQTFQRQGFTLRHRVPFCQAALATAAALHRVRAVVSLNLILLAETDMLHVPDACACLPANDHKGPHLRVCPAAGGRWQIHLARWQHVRGKLEGKLVFCLHLRPMHCTALPWPLPLMLRTPKGAMARDMCSLKCCWRSWQKGWEGGAAVSSAAARCAAGWLRHRRDMLLPGSAAAT